MCLHRKHRHLRAPFSARKTVFPGQHWGRSRPSLVTCLLLLSGLSPHQPASKSLFPPWGPPSLFSASWPLLSSSGFGARNDLSVLQVHPHHHGAYLTYAPPNPCLPHLPAPVLPQASPLFLVPGLPYPASGRYCRGFFQHPGLFHVQHLPSLLPGVCAQSQHVLEREL